MHLTYTSYSGGPITDWEQGFKAFLINPGYQPISTHTYADVSGFILSEAPLTFTVTGSVEATNFSYVEGVVRWLVVSDDSNEIIYLCDVEYPIPVPAMGVRIRWQTKVLPTKPTVIPYNLNTLSPYIIPQWVQNNNLVKLEHALVKSVNSWLSWGTLYLTDWFKPFKLTCENLNIPLSINDVISEVEVMNTEHWLPSRVDWEGSSTYPLKPYVTIYDNRVVMKNADLFSTVKRTVSGVIDLSSEMASNPITDYSYFYVVDSVGEGKVIRTTDLIYSSQNSTLTMQEGTYAIYYQSDYLKSCLLNKTLKIDNKVSTEHYYSLDENPLWFLKVITPELNLSKYSLEDWERILQLYPESTRLGSKMSLLFTTATYSASSVASSTTLSSTDEVLSLPKFTRSYTGLNYRDGSYFANTFGTSSWIRVDTEEDIYTTLDAKGEYGSITTLSQMFTTTNVPAFNNPILYNRFLHQSTVVGSTINRPVLHEQWDNNEANNPEFAYF